MVIAKWQGERDEARFQAALADPSLADPDREDEEEEPPVITTPRFERELEPA
jgi:hypothetical protein